LEENVPPRPKGRRRDLSRERKRLETQAHTQRDVGQFMIPWSVRDKFNKSLIEFHEMVNHVEEDVSPKTERSEHDEILFNECELGNATPICGPMVY
jgi:hypothetical protein